MDDFKFLLPIDVSYFKKDRDSGCLEKLDYQVSAAFSATLWESITSVVPMEMEKGSYICYGGNFVGEYVDLSKTPLEVEYIMDISRNSVPVLFVCESGTLDEPESPTSKSRQSSSMPKRRPSMMVKRALESRDSGLSLDGDIFELPDDNTIISFLSSTTNPVPLSVATDVQSRSISFNVDTGPEPLVVPIGDYSGQKTSICEQKQMSLDETHSSEDADIFDCNISSRIPPQRRQIKQIQPAQSVPNIYKISSPSHDMLLSRGTLSESASRELSKHNTSEEESPLPISRLNFIDKMMTLPAKAREPDPFHKASTNTHVRSPNRISVAFPIEYSVRDQLSREPVISSPRFTRERSSQVVKLRSNRGYRRGAIKRRKSTVDLDLKPYVLKLSIDHHKDTATSTDVEWSTAIKCSNFSTVGELKQLVNQALVKHGKMKTPSPSLTYVIDDQQYELLNESQFLQNTFFYGRAMKGNSTKDEDSGNLPGIVVTFPRQPPHSELVIYYRISQLTGIVLDTRVLEMGTVKFASPVLTVDLPEADFARRTLHDHVVQVTDERDEEGYALSTEVVTSDAPTILTLKIPVGNQVSMTFHYKEQFSFTKKVGIHSLARDVLRDIFPCLVACGLVKDEIDDYTLKLSGEECYIHGHFEMIAFKDIRRCIIKEEHIHLSVTTKPSTELYKRFNFSWLHLDSLTCSAHLHSEVSCAYRSDTQSVWECNDEFKLDVLRLENLPLEKSTKISVEVSLHLGVKLIHSAKNIGWFQQDNYTLQLNKKAEFCMKMKNVPKAAKALVVIRSSTSRSFYWGLVTLYDHLGMLRRGTHVLYLWNAKADRESLKNLKFPLIEDVVVVEKLNSILAAGPVANNPSPSAVRATISFGSRDKPIYFPSTSVDSREPFFKEHPSYRCAYMRRYLARYLTERRGTKGFENLAKDLLRVVNWADFSHCLEVYSLLDELKNDISQIPEHIGLQLLDSNFPDEVVREFAVYILEHKLTNETLEAYLLQLTQALKFEPNHDSALARYLLKKALTNKKIGHLFFWYLKSEIQDLSEKYSPSTVRFAVILEAYLKGCGEAMLTRFMDQVEVEKSLRMIRQKLTSPDKSGKGDVERMQEILHSELKRVEMNKFSFHPVFNSRLRMGKMRIEKCKILGSAKRPMWLELLNVDSTALTNDPVRLIFKTGDDLRQDMITLRIFALFESLWENEGLDLRLIPYGCMATGTNSGFIEVVKNAKTIKEVSGVREAHKLYEWIKGHQKNEFGEEDPEKLKQAINTFIHSCAGYSVATYILGIGDRHNDNIMVTTSGNLFHIDFGHFLGNIKHFMGFKKEWAPFVLTPDFVYVMGGEESESFKYYKHLCCRAFLILRRSADLIINLIAMMRSTGIPELTCVEDTEYVRNALALDKSDTEAERCFRNVIQRCLNLTWTVQVVWAAHIVINGARLKGSES